MTQPTDTEQAPADKLLELLYGELPEVDAVRTEEEVAGDAELVTALADFRSVRSLFADLPQEDPPPAVSAKVLAAAAEAAAPIAAARSASDEPRGFFVWLGNLFRPLAYHPGLAAVATLVVVGGVAGALYVTGKDKMARPGASSEQPAQSAVADKRAPAASPDPSGALMGKGKDDDAPARELKAAEESAAAEDNEVDSNAPVPQKARATRRQRVKTEKPRPKPDSARGFLDDGVEATGKSVFGGDSDRRRDKTRDSRQAGPSGGATSSGGKKSPVTTPTTKPPPPPADPAPEPVTAADSSVSEAQGESADSSKKSNEAKSLHKQALFRAKKGDCSTVVKLGARIRKIDSYFYDTVHLRDSSVQRCRSKKTLAK
jgi:hypothetical protein